ncbi:MAG TPA: hypothetical protein VIY48_20155 [Candidatus Paceibacterota bacterium]
MGEQRVKQIDRVLEFMQRTPDELVTLRRIATSLGIENTDSLSGALNALIAKYPNMERLQRGVYRWNSVPQEKPTSRMPEEFLLQYVSDKEGRILVRDTDTNLLWVMTPFEF